MAQRERLICQSSDLEEGGEGYRFALQTPWGEEVGFFVRYRGKVFGYINRCAHVPVELDWQKGQFFDPSGKYLICSVHGALFDPTTGGCLAGPCRKGRLPALEAIERGGEVFLVERD